MEIRNWLSEYKTLTDEKKAIYGESLRTNENLQDELHDLFEEELDAETIDPVCHQMFDFYRSGNPHLKHFVLDFVPTLLSAYFTALGSNNSLKHRSGSLETCLLGIYNLDTDKSRTEKLTIPSIYQPSIYHEPININPVFLSESFLNGQRTKQVEITTGSFPYFDRINSQNRSFVIVRVLKLYNNEIVNILPRSHWELCKFCCRLSRLRTGDSTTDEGAESFEDACSEEVEVFEVATPGITATNSQSYFNVASEVLLELLMSLYYILYTSHAKDAMMALDSIYWRAVHDLMPDVLLVSQAMKNTIQDLKIDLSQSLGAPITLSPNLTHQNPSIRDAITNASFRTQKLPDDIDVPDGAENHLSIKESPPIAFELADKKLPKLNIKIPGKKKGGAKKGGVKDLLGAKSPKHSISVSTGLSAGALSASTDTKLVAIETSSSSASKTKEGSIVRSASSKAMNDDDANEPEISEVSVRRSIFGAKMASRDEESANRRLSEVQKLTFDPSGDLEMSKMKVSYDVRYARQSSVRQVPEEGEC